MKKRILPLLGFIILALPAILREGDVYGQDPSTNYPPSYVINLLTGTTNFYPNWFAAAVVSNSNARYVLNGTYTYVKTNPLTAPQYLIDFRGRTNVSILASKGTRFIFDNQCTNDVIGSDTTTVFMDLDGANNVSVDGLEIESKRRLASQTNFNFDVFACSVTTNVTLKNCHGQVDSYATNDPTFYHSDAFIVAVSGDTCNFNIENCLFGVLLPVAIYDIHNTYGQHFCITHGNSGGVFIKDSVSYGIETAHLSQNSGVEPTFVNFRARYPGAMVGLPPWYTDIYATDLTNAAALFNEQENLSYVLPGTDPIFSGYDQYTNLDSVTIIPTNVMPPSASFTAAPANGVVPLAVTFTDTSTGGITNWFWSFGDGNTTNATTKSMRHTYVTPGTYSVTEIVTGRGSSTNTWANYITVLPPPPLASFTVDPTGGATPLTVTFTDTSIGSISNWFWSFGDGNTTNATTKSMSHTYVTASTYSVTEIATGPGGSSTATRANYITILSPTEASHFQAWLSQYFNCTNCVQSRMNADADGTGQNNLFKYTAGLDPTNPASVFVIKPASVQNLPGQFRFQFTPVVAGRSYTPQYSLDPGSGVWQPLTNYAGPVTNGAQVTVTDLSATNQRKFYRIDIQYVAPADSVGDGIPDSWRAQYFTNQPTNNVNGTMTNSQSCATCDADGTGQNNLFKYVAGLDPTNPASIFILKIASIPAQPNQKNLIYNPIVTGRTYTPQFRTNLTSGAAYATLTTTSPLTTNGNQVSVNDTQATQTQKFYRVDISLP